MTHHPNTPASRNEEVWALRFPEDGGRLCLSTVFDTEEEAKEYASRCRSQPVGVVRLASRTEQAAPSVASGAPLPKGALGTLSNVIATLREYGRFEDEEGDATDILDDLHEWLQALADSAAPGAAIAAREQEAGDWAVDRSAGRPILVHKNCSVIEAEDAEYVLQLIAADIASRQEFPAIAAREQPVGWEKLREHLALAILGFATREGRKSLEAAGQMLEALADGPMPYLRAASRQEAPAASAQHVPDWKRQAIQSATPYCLGCEVEGHRTNECHATHGFNSPRELEIARLSWSVPAARSPATMAQPVDAGASRKSAKAAAEYEVREWMGENDVVLKSPAYRALITLVLAAQSAAQPCPSQGCDRTEALQAAHRLGFLRAAGWMQQDHLFADVSSPAYRKDRDHDIAALSGLEHVGKEQSK